MQWLIEEVFRPATDIAQMLADADWNLAEVFSSKEYHDARGRLRAGLERAHNVRQDLPRGDVQLAVQNLQLDAHGFETANSPSGAYAMGLVLYINGKLGWTALLHHLPPGAPVPPLDVLPSKNPKSPVPTAITAAGCVGGGPDRLRSPERTTTPPPTKKKSWHPSKHTLHVIRLMKQGLSNDAILERADVKVKKSARNIRQIRSRAQRFKLLKPSENGKRDTA